MQPLPHQTRAAARTLGIGGLRMALVTMVAAILSGCIEDGRPAACEGPTEISLALTAGALTPADPSVCRDQGVTLRFESEVDGVIHIHGYDDAVPATAVVAGETLELGFTATRSGQFPIELHLGGDPRGAEIGIFTVREP